jgi:MFS family permease
MPRKLRPSRYLNANSGKGEDAGRSGVAATFLRWTGLRAACHRGYVLVSSLYFVIHDGMSAAQLLLLGTVFSLTLVLSDIPAGAWSDAFSRKWPLVIGHGFLAAGMIMTGLVTAFPLVIITQVLWALGWACSIGADVAWLTDEFNQPGRIARVLARRARRDLSGGAVGMIAFGVLARVAGLGTAVVLSGAGMALVGLFVAVRFTEDNFVRASGRRLSASLAVLGRGMSLARRDREIWLVFAATLLINAASMTSRLFPLQLISLGFPGNTVLWYTALGIVASVVGMIALRLVEARIEGAGAARRGYALACLVGVAGLVLLALAPSALIGCGGVLLVSGIAYNVTRAVSEIWVNRRTTSDVRATVHSFLSQAESVGEIAGGLALAVLAHAAGGPAALLAAAALIAVTGVLVARSRTDGAV